MSNDFKKMAAKSIITPIFVEDDYLEITCSRVESISHYACYLYINNTLVEKTNYQRENIFKFNFLGYSLNDEIKIRCYFLDKVTDERSARTIELTEVRLRDFALSSEQAGFSNEKNIILGEDLVRNKQLQLGPFPSYKINDEFDFWGADPFNNRSWQWRLHWFEYVRHLLAYYDASKDLAALELLQKSIDSWLELCLEKADDFEFVWHDHATALRAEVLLTAHCYIHKYSAKWGDDNQDFMSQLKRFLEDSKEKLLEDGFYSKHTNHGLEQARVLLLLSIYFQDISAQSVAVKRISSELAFSFTSEGVHKENSPGYHQFVLKVFLGIISRFPKSILGTLSQEFDRIGTKALEFLAHIIRPDGLLPIIGDTELIRATDGYSRYFKDDIAYQEYLYSSTQGKRGSKPRTNFKIYPKSGYAVYRDKWRERSDFAQTFQLILKAGCLSRYHHQQDEGNIVLYAYGEDWLIDSGLYNYVNRDPIRKYMRGREAHNIPVIAGSLYHKDFSHRIENWQLDYEQESENLSLFCENNVLQGITHKREIHIPQSAKGKISFSVIDDMTMAVKSPQNITFYWHFPADKVINIMHDNALTIEGTSGANMTIKFTPLPESITLEKGIVNGSVVSCISHKFGEYEQSKLIKVTYTANSALSVCTAFTLEKAGK